MNNLLSGRIMGGLCVIVALVHAQSALAQTDSQTKVLDVVCFTERPAIAEGESTSVQAWGTTPDGQSLSQPISFAWQVTEGTVEDSGSDVQWNLSSVTIMPGEFHKKVTATVKGKVPGFAEAVCSVEVFIGQKEQAGSEDLPKNTRATVIRSVRQYLLPNQKEESGFGLYSYLLFPAPPGSDEEKSRYLKTLESCLRMMESVEEHLARHRRPIELNTTHIPVKRVPKYSKVFSEWAANVLAVYDYTTSQKLLDKFGNTYQRGPYLISVLNQPLSEREPPVQEHLLQDFTGKVPEVTSQLVGFFIYRAAQQRTWTDESLQNVRLNVRNLIAVAAKVAPDVASAMITLVQAKQTR